MAGIFYGVGVGPGAPELMTLKAINTIRQCNVIAFPGENINDSVAYRIAATGVPEIADKKLIPINMPMSGDRDEINRAHDKAVEVIEEILVSGENVAFLVLGDVTIYSTYMYLQRNIASHGFSTKIISGVTSFCAAAAACDISLCQWDEKMIIIPSRHQLPERFEPDKNYVLMKAGSCLSEIQSIVKECGREAYLVENCGMSDEKIYVGTEKLPEKAGYYSVVIVK